MTARRVIINGRFLAKPMGGVSRVGRELLRAVVEEMRERPEIDIKIATPSAEHLAPFGAEGACASERAAYASNLGEQILLPASYPDATILSFCNSTPLLARRSIVWIHDTHVFDAPDSYSPAFRLWYRVMLSGVIARKFQIVTVSEFSRGRLIARGAPAERITLISNGGDHLLRSETDPSVRAAAAPDGQPYILLLGSPAKLKNMDFALRTLSAALDPALKILVVGLHQQGPYAPSDALSGDARIVILPSVSDGALRSLYANARVVVVPSLLEGFGLFAAEALYEGAPLALSNRASHPEVGGKAALYFDPTSAAEMISCVTEAMKPDTTARLRLAAEQQRKRFQWREAARAAIALSFPQAR